MKSIFVRRAISVVLCLLIVVSCLIVSLTATSAAVLPDGYEHDFEAQGKSYGNMGILEDQYDLIEPMNDRFPIISPSSDIDASYPPLFTGSYLEVEDYFRQNGMSDGLPIVPPTKIKAEKFMGYSSYGYDDVIATVNGKPVKAYMVAANAIMAGCTPELTPICIAFTQALSDNDYLDSLRSGKLTPMMYVNGPIARQIGIDNAQGMTTEESNISVGRFMELALINLAGIERNNAFGNVQPLVFSENEEVCLNIGWEPHHVEQGYDINENVITASSFAMWGNNVTPATDLPEEIMKVLAWDITEKNLGGLGSASIEENANTKRLIFITESVATALSKLYKSKEALEGALVENARRPLWMRTYAYYYANTGGALSKSFSDVYDELKNAASEDAKSTASPSWMNGITYANIDTVATMTKGNTNIIVTGDISRNKTQVMPGGISVSRTVGLSDRWDELTTSVNFFPIEDFVLTEQNHTITPPSSVPSVLSNGDYRILDPATGSSNMTRKGRVYYDSSDNTLYYYAQNATSASSIILDPQADKDFIDYLNNLGYNSSFTVSNGKISAVVVRFPSNASKLNNNTVALTSDSFENMGVTLHANNTSNSNAAGGLAKDGATVNMSDTVTSFNVNLDGTVVMGDTTNSNFVKLSGSKVTVDPSVEAGATAIIGTQNADGTYRTMTLVNGGDGTYTITYNTANTISNTTAPYYLKGTFNSWDTSDTFSKTENPDIISITKEIPEGTYEFKIHRAGLDEWYGNGSTTIDDTVNRTILTKTADNNNLTLNATGGKYEFKYEISTKKLSVFCADNTAEEEHTEPTEAVTEEPTEVKTKTVYVGVIEYVKDFVPTLHYWNAQGEIGDAQLTATGDTAKFSLGSSYWNNEPQTFVMYTAEIPDYATSLKTFRGSNNDRWADETVTYDESKALLMFEYGNVYHNQSQTYSPVEPTEEPTTEPTTVAPTTTEPTSAPTTAPTEPSTSSESEITLKFKSSSSVRYIPSVSVGGKQYDMTAEGSAISTNVSQTQKFYWYTADVPITEGQNLSVIFTNQHSMYASATISSVSNSNVYYFGCDDLNKGTKAVDISDKPEYVRNFVKSSTHMLSNDPTSAGVATTMIDSKMYKLGDADTDNELSIMDATTIQKHLAKIIQLSETGSMLADYDIDTQLSIRDVTRIQIYLANGQ